MLKNFILQKFLLFYKKKKKNFFFSILHYFYKIPAWIIYSTNLFNKIFILLHFYYYFLQLAISLSSYLFSFNPYPLTLPICRISILQLQRLNLFLKKKKKKKIVAQPQSPTIIQGTFTNARARKMTNSPHSITQTTQKIPKKKKKFIHKPKKS